MSDFDDVPPLEDMTSVVERVKKISVTKNSGSELNNQAYTKVVGDDDTKELVNSTKKAIETKPKVFGGFQKGFLLSSQPRKCSTSKSTHKPSNKNIDYVIKPTQTQSNSLVLNDVQDAIKNSTPSTDWVNEDILNLVGQDKKLIQQLNQPKFNEAVELMKTNPKQALERYKDDPEVGEFFKKFYGILGKHFNKLAAKSPTTESPNIITSTKAQGEPHLMSQEEKEVKRILDNAELRTILEKQSTQMLVKALKENPDQAQYMLRSGDADLKSDVRKLIAAGVLNIQ